MKYHFPNNHGLSEKITSDLVFRENEELSLTDAQFTALENGLGHGESLLVIAPTSTGKTQIATWAIASGIEQGCNNVYLVTHRALAKQKFFDFQEMLADKLFSGDRSGIVLANGDTVIDGEGNLPADPLSAPLVVATYEKYLAMLSASGIPSSMEETIIVCDEIQLIGDKERGQNVEVLLTLLKSIGWKQFIGLSAVLSTKDGEELASWLGIKAVRALTREKELSYEYWKANGIERVRTTSPNKVENEQLPSGLKHPKTLDVVNYFRGSSSSKFPIIVFCMRKDDVYELAAKDLGILNDSRGAQVPLDLGDLPPTASNSFLSRALVHRIAIHCADLTDEERKIVEEGLLKNEIDVVYATSTLAAGVNFPLGAAIFHSWLRYDFKLKKSIPISASEFHNMAGRVGRMGSEHSEGKVIFFPSLGQFSEIYKQYLQLDQLPPLGCRINEETFDQLVLQLISTGLCNSREDVKKLISGSFSGVKEQDSNIIKFKKWPALIDKAIDELTSAVLMLEMRDGQLVPTPVGKAVAQSGLKPASAKIIIDYFYEKGDLLSEYINGSSEKYDPERFAFLIFALAFTSPEFKEGMTPSRRIPHPIKDLGFNPDKFADDLLEPAWFINRTPTNAATFACDWINGERLNVLESRHDKLRAGMILGMYRDLGWMTQGISSILSAASDYRIVDDLRPVNLRKNDEVLKILRRIPRAINRLTQRLYHGLPDEILWMSELNHASEPFWITREEMISFKEKGFFKPAQMMLGDAESDEIRIEVFIKTKPSPKAKSNWIRNRSRLWKAEQREKAALKHKSSAKGCSSPELIDEFYESRQEKFEECFEKILQRIEIKYQKLDDGNRTGAPDYLLSLQGSPDIIFELKSKQGSSLVNFNAASEVLSASEIHGYKNEYCVTLCHPGVDPSVPMAIIGSGRLCVIESVDLGEAFLRLCQGRLTQAQLWQWLTTPGQALIEDLPFMEY